MLWTFIDKPEWTVFYGFLRSGSGMLDKENRCLYHDMIQSMTPSLLEIVDCSPQELQQAPPQCFCVGFLPHLHHAFLSRKVQFIYRYSFPPWFERHMSFCTLNICFYVYVLLWMYFCTPHMCVVPTDARRAHQMPWNRGYRQFWATVREMEIEPRSCGTTGNGLNNRVVFPSPGFIL